MDTPLFKTFKAIIPAIDKNKVDISDYLQNNSLTPNNEYLERYLATLQPLSLPEKVSQEIPVESNIAIKESLPEVKKIKDKVNQSNKFSNNLNAKTALTFFMNKGLTKEQASGIVGNLYAESAFNSSAIGDKGTSFGIAQWHKDRWDNLKKFSSLNGVSEHLFEGQLEFYWHELQTSERNAYLALLKTNNPENAAQIISNKFERPLKYDPKRELYARQIYEAYV